MCNYKEQGNGSALVQIFNAIPSPFWRETLLPPSNVRFALCLPFLGFSLRPIGHPAWNPQQRSSRRCCPFRRLRNCAYSLHSLAHFLCLSGSPIFCRIMLNTSSASDRVGYPQRAVPVKCKVGVSSQKEYYADLEEPMNLAKPKF
jgi:hypothetical protein